MIDCKKKRSLFNSVLANRTYREGNFTSDDSCVGSPAGSTEMGRAAQELRG